MSAELHPESSPRRSDLTFALAVTAMLLVSPICWEHYLLLLLVPLAVVWVQLPASRFARGLFLLIVAAIWLGYPLVWTVFDLNGRTAKPVHSLGVLSYQFYALLGLFALILMELPAKPACPTSSSAIQSAPVPSEPDLMVVHPDHAWVVSLHRLHNKPANQGQPLLFCCGCAPPGSGLAARGYLFPPEQVHYTPSGSD